MSQPEEPTLRELAIAHLRVEIPKALTYFERARNTYQEIGLALELSPGLYRGPADDLADFISLTQRRLEFITRFGSQIALFHNSLREDDRSAPLIDSTLFFHFENMDVLWRNLATIFTYAREDASYVLEPEVIGALLGDDPPAPEAEERD